MRQAPREKAPEFSDCLTSIYYIFKKALKVQLPLTFIGNMPRNLLSLNDWRALKIDHLRAQCGDILFVKNKTQDVLITHAALVFDVDKIFHCTQLKGTAFRLHSKLHLSVKIAIFNVFFGKFIDHM